MRPKTLWRAFKRKKRTRIILSAGLIGLIAGGIELGMPIEDLFVHGRAALRQYDAPQDIVVVAIDDKTLQEMNVSDVSRSTDAELTDKLLEKGARHIFFDRSYAFAEEPAEDIALVKSLERHRGKVSMGAVELSETGGAEDFRVFVPHERFRPYIEVVSLVGYTHPFKLSSSFPFRTDTPIGSVPSLSAALAGVETPSEGRFRPDYAIRASSIPTVSYVDVIRGNYPAGRFAETDVVVAPVASIYNDYHDLVGQGYLPGAYFHVLAAHTLRNQIPLNIGWLPIFLLAMSMIVLALRGGRAPGGQFVSGLVVVIIGLPFLLDFFAIEAHAFPALLASLVAGFRARTLQKVEEAGEVNSASGLPSLHALRSAKQPIAASLIALKVRNYASIVSSFAGSVEADLASELSRRIRIGDPEATVYHEGDTFFWWSERSNPLDLIEHLEGLHGIVQKGVRIEDTEIDLSFNCGIDIDGIEKPGNRVSNALKAVNSAVRDEEIVAIHESSGDDVQFEISLLSSLDSAIDAGDVWVAYQPKLDLATNRILSAEALVRWTHPERGPISPEKFIGIAEDYHRIDRITRFVLNEAVSAAAQFSRHEPEFSISVNVSAQLLRFVGLPEMVRTVLAEHDFPADRLVLEITETDRLDRSAKTVEMMHKLVEMGLRLSIDDFGTGNATIDYLRYLPASEVKIDKVFVQAMDTNEGDLLLVQSIIEMAHSLDRKVVAEGVETDRILDMLKLLDCDQAQGFQISRPIPFALMEGLIGSQSLSSTG